MQRPSLNVYLFLLVFGCIEFFKHEMGWKIFLVFAACALLADQIQQLCDRVKQLEAKLLK
jgi:hypothetical protein